MVTSHLCVSRMVEAADIHREGRTSRAACKDEGAQEEGQDVVGSVAEKNLRKSL